MRAARAAGYAHVLGVVNTGRGGTAEVRHFVMILSILFREFSLRKQG